MCWVLTTISELAKLGKEFLVGSATKAGFETSGVKRIIPRPKATDKRVCAREFVCIICFRDSRWMAVLVSKLMEGIKKFSISIRHLVLWTRLDILLAALKRLFTISFFEGAGHLIGKVTSLDMRVVLANDFLGVIERTGGGRVS
jgi:hypothetical protein